MGQQTTPMVLTRNNLDSAFPPLAPGVPVRSVYERAGFEVFKGRERSGSKSYASSIASSSTKSPNLNGPAQIGQDSASLHKKTGSRSSWGSSKESWFRRKFAGSRHSSSDHMPPAITLVPPIRSDSRPPSAISSGPPSSRLNYHMSPSPTPGLEQQYNFSYDKPEDHLDMSNHRYPSPSNSAEGQAFDRPISTASSVYSSNAHQNHDSYHENYQGNYQMNYQDNYHEESYQQHNSSYQNGDYGYRDYNEHSAYALEHSEYAQHPEYVDHSQYTNSQYVHPQHPIDSHEMHDEISSSSTNSMYSQPCPQSTLTSPGELVDPWNAQKENSEQPFPSVAPLRTRNSVPRSPAAPGKKICRGCNQVIQGKCVSSKDGGLTGKWHRTCFKCFRCSAGFDSEFYVLNNQPYCRDCYHYDNNSICQNCGLGIEGRCLETFSDTHGNIIRYHPDCFSCTECGKSLRDEEYYSVNGKTLCSHHAFSMDFGPSTQLEKRRTRLMMM